MHAERARTLPFRRQVGDASCQTSANADCPSVHHSSKDRVEKKFTMEARQGHPGDILLGPD